MHGMHLRLQGRTGCLVLSTQAMQAPEEGPGFHGTDGEASKLK
jgi:hypothetical protein